MQIGFPTQCMTDVQFESEYEHTPTAKYDSDCCFLIASSGYWRSHFVVPHLRDISRNHVRPATVVAICFFPPRRETVTTGKGSLVPLDKLKLLVSNVGSLLMDSLL